MSHGAIDIDMGRCDSTVNSTMCCSMVLWTARILTASGGYDSLLFSDKSKEEVSEKPFSDVH